MDDKDFKVPKTPLKSALKKPTAQQLKQQQLFAGPGARATVTATVAPERLLANNITTVPTFVSSIPYLDNYGRYVGMQDLAGKTAKPIDRTRTLPIHFFCLHSPKE